MSGMSPCKTCSQPFKNQLIASCVICNELFHADPECAVITASEVKVLQLKNKPLLEFTCNDSKQLGRDRHYKVLEKLSSDIDVIEGKCNTIPSIEDQLDDMKEKIETFQVVANDFPARPTE
ncbi:hypothetical protein QAD02_021406 [Eretmocerus hayati]|uniref:Uncharacterized protein n=1 Tax=Eretmocerus hayati TaxID=131215 RepID=A0ACC2PQ65_9HYME|nr:hypothetical protein QAD02_021406 [Eretmocerus hayati]